MPKTPGSPQAGYAHKVFLNVPYDGEYGNLFAGMIACLIGLGFVPICGLQTESEGGERLSGILDLLSGCGASIHDLSRMDLWGELAVPRFNMPFELGIAYTLRAKVKPKNGPRHRIFVFDEKKRRFEAALSDMSAFDAKVHNGSEDGLLSQILNSFQPSSGLPKREKLEKLMAFTTKASRKIQDKLRVADPFQLHIFNELVNVATVRAKALGLVH